MNTSIIVTLPEACRPYIAQALVRLSYLHPEVRFDCTEGVVVAEQNSAGTVSAREIRYQVYREKIYQESLPMRELMYRTLLT